MSFEDFKAQVEAEAAKLEQKTEEKSETSEENQVEIEISEEKVSETSQPEMSNEEKEALSMGWDPNHKGPNFVSAKEFIERGSFFKKIDSQNKKIDQLTETVKYLADLNKKVEEASYNRGIQDALARRKQAVEVGDVDAFERAEREIQAIQQNPPVAPPVTAPAFSQEILDFQERNKSWFNTDNETNKFMADAAIGFNNLLKQHQPNLSEKERLVQVEEAIKKQFSDKFTNPNRTKPAMITSSTRGTKSSSSNPLVGRLTPFQREIFKQAQAVDSTLKIEEYARQLDLTGDLPNE